MNKSTDIFAYLQTQISLGINLAISFTKRVRRFTWVFPFTYAGVTCATSGINELRTHACL